jgi:hypothetical protein
MDKSSSGAILRIGFAVGGSGMIVVAACATGSDAIYGDFDAETASGGHDGGPSPSSSGSSGNRASGSSGASTGSGSPAGSGVPGSSGMGGGVGEDAGSSGDDAGTSADAASSCATSCTGCCDPNLGCIPGTDDPACGLNGAACRDCTTSNQTCQSGSCSGPSGSSGSSGASSGSSSSGSSGSGGSSGGGRGCGMLNCFIGCCQGGMCLPRTTDSACGNGGAQCQDCTSMGKTCSRGSCR